MLRVKDTQFLDQRGYRWSVTSTDHLDLLVIDQYPLPEGLRPSITRLLLQLQHGFPDVPTDMFWLADQVHRESGSLPPATDTTYQHPDGSQWWRWSRHFTQWRSGIDGLENVLGFVNQCLLVAAGES